MSLLRMSLAPRLQPFLIVAAACIGLLALAGYDLLRERRLAVQGTKDDTANITRVLSEHLRQKLQRLDTLLRLGSGPLLAYATAAVATQPTPVAGAEPELAALRQQLRTLLPTGGLMQRFEWLDAAGRLRLAEPAVVTSEMLTDVSTANQPAAPGHNWAQPLGPGRADELVFARPEKLVLSNARPSSAATSPAASSSQWVLPVARRLIDADGRYVGALVALLELDSTYAAFAAVNAGESGFVTLFLSQGWMVATLPRADAYFARNWIDTPLFKEHLPQASAGSVQQVVVRDNTERVYSYRTLAPYPLVLSMGVSLTDALAGWRLRGRWSAGLCVAVVSALFWAANLLARQNRRREAAEQALAEAAERLRSIVDHVADGLVVFDDAGRVESVNPAAAALFGIPSAELVGHDVGALVPALRAAGGQHVGPPRAEASVLRADGSALPVDIAVTKTWRAGQPLFVALIRDITHSKNAQAVLAAAREDTERSARFLRAITDNIPLHVAYLDRQDRYQFVNQAHCQRLRLPRAAIIGHTRLELSGQATPASTQMQIDKVLAGQATRFEFEDPLAGPGHTIEAHFVPDVADDGSVRGYYAATADVTERNQQQQRTLLALAERETLLREVYHRVKNNLQVVQSLLNLQQRSLPEGPARTAIDDSVRRIRAMALVHEKLYQTGTLSAVSLREYTEDLLRHLGEASGVHALGITLQADIGDVQGSLDVAVPYGLLVTELVSNSLKHGFADGCRGTVSVVLRRTAGVWVLRVSDDGVGLAANFDIHQLQSMGLQLATSLAAQLGGELQARPAQPGQAGTGAVFTAALSRLG